MFTGKPKVFLLQYCRLAELSLVPKVSRGPGSKTRSPPPVSDVLLINSTIPGHVSLRNTVRGSWVVQCLGNYKVDRLSDKMTQYE